jgi:hypothetical protein
MEQVSGSRFATRRTRALERRVADLERDVEELRRHNLRLAELTDVVQELLVPMASRDQARIDAAIERFTGSL